MRGHTLADCRKVSIETKKDLMSLRYFGMCQHLNTVKKNKTMSQRIQHVVQEEVDVPETETPGVSNDVYVPAPGL